MIIEHRSSLRGEITVPGDKSISHKAILLASLANGVSEIDDIFMSEDCLSTINCFRKMNVSIEIKSNNRLKICGNGLHGLSEPSSPLNTGKSNTAIRLLLGILVGQKFNTIVIRDESVQRRLVSDMVKPLKFMGANIIGREDASMCPLSIAPSTLIPKTHELGLENRHVKSSILLASLYTEGNTIIRESVPYRNHTELMLNYFGANITYKNGDIISHNCSELNPQHVSIPGDMSIAAYFIVAACIVPNSEILIKNVGYNKTRNGLIDALKRMGANINILNEHLVGNEMVADIHVTSSNLSAIDIDNSLIPRLYDELPALIVACCIASGKSTISGLTGYKINETGLLTRLNNELIKMGASITMTHDSIEINGGKPLSGKVVESYNNKVLTLALSTIGMFAEGETLIRKSQILDTTFPDFLPVLNSL